MGTTKTQNPRHWRSPMRDELPVELIERVEALGFYDETLLWQAARARVTKSYKRLSDRDDAILRVYYDMYHALFPYYDKRPAFRQQNFHHDAKVAAQAHRALELRAAVRGGANLTEPRLQQIRWWHRQQLIRDRRDGRAEFVENWWGLLYPRNWVYLFGHPDGSMFLLYPLYCLASIGVIWGFVIVVTLFYMFAHGPINGLVQAWNIPAPYSLALTGRLTGQADRNAWAHLIVMAVLVSPLFSIWGYLKAGGSRG